eukprot:6456559-Amphidinium_carterae.3
MSSRNMYEFARCVCSTLLTLHHAVLRHQYIKLPPLLDIVASDTWYFYGPVRSAIWMARRLQVLVPRPQEHRNHKIISQIPPEDGHR